MSVRILCDTCNGWREVGHGTGEDTRVCPTCWDEATKRSLGYIVKGCENCGKKRWCCEVVKMYDKYDPGDADEKITFCTAWEETNEQ